MTKKPTISRRQSKEPQRRQRWVPRIGLSVASALFLSLFIVCLSALVVRELDAQSRKIVETQLKSVHRIAREALQDWADDQKAHTTARARSEEFRRVVRILTAANRTPDRLRSHPAQERLRRMLQLSMESEGWQGFFVIAPNAISLASMRDVNIGTPNLLAAQPGFLQAVLDGDCLLSSPMPSDVSLPDADGRLAEGRSTMFVAAPVRDDSGRAVAVLAFRIEPEQNFSSIARLARFGKTGHTYLFDRTGRMVTRDPFAADSYTMPSPNRERAQARAAAKAIAGDPGIDLDGYRDYHAEPVVGTWSWNEKLGFGVVTEMDLREAYAPFRHARKTILLITMIVVFICFGVALVFGLRHRETDAVTPSSMRQGTDAKGSWWNRPLLIHAKVAFGIFGAEVVIMWVLEWLDLPEGNLAAFADAAMLTAVSLPFIYLTVVRPVKRAEAEVARKAAEATILHEVTAMAAETTSQRDAFLRGVRIICKLTNWPIGHVYVAANDGSGELAPSGLWYFEDAQSSRAFREVTERTRFAPGIGLPGRILKSGEPAWIANVQTDANFPRARLCSEIGVKGAFGFPVQVAGRTVAVLEFFATIETAPDKQLLLTMRSVGMQLGRVLERRQAQSELQSLSRAVDATADAVVVTDRNGTIQSINPAFTTITGYEADDVVGRNPRVLKSGKHGADFYRAMWDTLNDGRVWSGDLVNRRRDHSLYYASLTISPILDDRGACEGFVGVQRDVSDRKRTEEELMVARNAAEEAKAEAERTNEQLEESVERANRLAQEAETANVAKSEFLANMSHEIRTPMNGIIGMTELALDTDLSEEQRDYLAMVKSSADVLLTVINDILDFSKIEAGKLDFESIDFHIRRCVDDTVKGLALRARQKNLALNCRIDPDVPEVLVGDPGRLGQVLTNLIGNSIKFTAQGEVTVSVEVAARTGDEATLQFAVRDTGIGIPRDKQALIFQSFAQADGSTTRKYGGTGLGLTIGKQLVELMGGRIWLESEEGTGSTFRFTARFSVGKVLEVSGDRAAAEPAPAGDLPDGVTLSVLLAEDNQVNQKLVVRILEKRGHSVTVAGDGSQAVAEAQQKSFDLILMDVQMPVMGGLEATAAIRARERTSGRTHVPIVAMTAHAMKGDRDRCLAAGMDDYISKPIQVRKMLEVIGRVTRLSAPDERAAGFAPSPSAPESAAEDPIDFDDLSERLDGDEEFMWELLTLFLQDGPQLIESLRASLEGPDLATGGRHAHSLAGAASNVGATQLARVARQAEQAAREEALEDLSTLTCSLEEEFEALTLFLSSSSRTGSPGSD